MAWLFCYKHKKILKTALLIFFEILISCRQDKVSSISVFVMETIRLKRFNKYFRREVSAMDNIIKEIRNEFNRIENNCQEANLQFHVITNTFLDYCGYDVKNLVLGEPTVKGFTDIYVPTIGTEELIIEVKNGKHDLITKDIFQALRYAITRKQRFAILTNGKEYVLLDRYINSESQNNNDLKSYVVFWFNVFKAKGKDLTELKFFKYLNFENLYVNKSTHFFCDIARYREWKIGQGMSEGSWTAYRCTLNTFFDYYAQNKIYKYEFEDEGKLCYENLSIENFRGFIQERKRNKGNTSTRTIENNFSHVYDMLHELKKHGRISNIALSESRMQNLSAYGQTERKKEIAVINVEDIGKAIDFWRKRKNANRNIVVFLLTVSLGLERSQLIELKWESFDKNLKHIKIDGRKIELCKLLQEYLSLLRKESETKKIKSSYVLVVYYKKKYKKMSEWAINGIFDELKNITNDERWKNYSPKYLRNCLIVSLFEAKYPLEEIIYITGIDIKNIANYITMDMILARKDVKVNWNNLYKGALCRTVS